MQKEVLGSSIVDRDPNKVQQVGSFVTRAIGVAKERVQYAIGIFNLDSGFELTPQQRKVLDTGPMSLRDIQKETAAIATSSAEI